MKERMREQIYIALGLVFMATGFLVIESVAGLLFGSILGLIWLLASYVLVFGYGGNDV